MKRILAALWVLCIATGIASAEIGDDGLHKAPWMRDTFKDLGEDLAEATAEGKRLMVLVEQRGCIYCTKLHEEVFVIPEIADYIEENFFVVQVNMFGDTEMTDFDGTALPDALLRRLAAGVAAMWCVSEIRDSRISGRLDIHKRVV